MGGFRKAAGLARVLSALALPCLGGCLLERSAPDLSAPAIPARYQECCRLPASPPADWARSYRSPELTRLVEQAARDNFDIAAAAARLRQAEAQARVSASGLYPQLSGSGNASHSRSPGTLRSSQGPFRASTGENFSLGLSASYALDFWGKYSATAEAGALSAEASLYEREVVALTSVSAVANGYLSLLLAQDRMRLAQRNIALADRVLQVIKARLGVGTATALDVAQQESVVANLRASLPIYEQQVLQGRNTLAVLLGRTPESVQIRGGSLFALAVPQIAAGLPAQLLLRRPDIASAETLLLAQNAQIHVARAAFLPDVKLTAQGGVESLALKTLLRPEAAFASVAGGLTQAIFTGGQLEGQLEATKARYEELLADYRKSIVQALADVENALIAVRLSAAHEAAQQRAVAAAERAYRITEERLREGTIDIVTLLNTQQTLFQAQDQLSQVRLQRLQASVALYQALGGGWSYDRHHGAAGLPAPETAP